MTELATESGPHPLDCERIRPNVRASAESPWDHPIENVEALANRPEWEYSTRAVFGAELRMFAGLADIGRGRDRADAPAAPEACQLQAHPRHPEENS